MLNLGPKSKVWLANIGIHTLQELRSKDAVAVYWQVKQQQPAVSINLLYALVGAQLGVHWIRVAQTQKTELLIRLEAARELTKMVADQDTA
jgi:DNA transformation protein